MGQFDVYLNPHADVRARVPYVVDVQSSLIEQLPTRLVMPISRVGAGAHRLPGNLCPTIEIEGELLTLMGHQLAPVSARLLKKPVASISNRSGDLAAAMDAVLGGF